LDQRRLTASPAWKTANTRGTIGATVMVGLESVSKMATDITDDRALGGNLCRCMCAFGQKRTFSEVCVMSALPPKADIRERVLDVRFGP
jgi:hypothetical protein